MAGIQAEHIIHGEHPIYYFGQPYMGSLQMYLIVGILFFTGPAVRAARIEPLLISLLIVTLTWFFSDVLAEGARLSQQAKRLFMFVSTLVAAFAPLYDTVEELRTTGGYIEAFTLMLWLLFCAYHLTQRWKDGARPEISTQRGVLEAIQVGLFVVLGIYFLSQGIAYLQADASNTFQGTGCVSANLTDQSQIINYMQQTKMHYAWATGWLGDPITFKTNGCFL